MTDFARRLACAVAIAAFGLSTAAAAPADAIKLTPPKSVVSKKDPPKSQPAKADAANTAEQPQAQQTQQAQPPAWAAACSGASRSKPLDCAVEQRLLLQNGQLVTLVRVSIPADTGKP